MKNEFDAHRALRRGAMVLDYSTTVFTARELSLWQRFVRWWNSP